MITLSEKVTEQAQQTKSYNLQLAVDLTLSEHTKTLRSFFA